MPFSFYLEHTRAMLDVLANATPDIADVQVAMESEALIREIGCFNAWDALGAVAPERRSEAFLSACPPAQELVGSIAAVTTLPIPTVLTLLAMTYDAQKLGLEKNLLHRAALEAVMGR